jgi:hypothetical protein
MEKWHAGEMERQRKAGAGGHNVPVYPYTLPAPWQYTRSPTACTWSTGVPVHTRRILLPCLTLVPFSSSHEATQLIP